MDTESIIRIDESGVAQRIGDAGAHPYVPTTFVSGEEYEQRNLLTDRFMEEYYVADPCAYLYSTEGLKFNITDPYLGYCSVSGAEDGISGEVQNNPMTVWHLEKNPSAMQVQIFSPKEVSAVLMATDGANALRFLPLGEILLAEDAQDKHVRAHFARLRPLSFAAASAALHEQALSCSDGNALCGGRGDDCSIVYIKTQE